SWSEAGGARIEPGRSFAFAGDTAIVRALRARAPQRVDEVHDADTRDLWEELGIRTGIAAPILVDGGLWGAIGASLMRDTTFAPDAEHRLGEFAALVAQAIANAEAR